MTKTRQPKRSRFALLLAFALFVCAALIFNSCTFDRPEAEGVIYYDLEFPFLEDNMLKNVFPEEMKLYFKNDKMYGEVRSLGGIVTTSFIADNDEKIIIQMLKNYSDYYCSTLDEPNVRRSLSSHPGIRYEATDRTELLAGFMCKVTIAHFLTDSVPPITLLHTDEIDIENPNWYSPFHEMSDVLLGYEVEQFGMRMKLRANTVAKKVVEDQMLVKRDKYKEIPVEDLSEMMSGMLTDFID